MIDSQQGMWGQVGYNQLISNKREWSGLYLIKQLNTIRNVADLVDFTPQEQPEDNLMVAISWAWYNGSWYKSTSVLLRMPFSDWLRYPLSIL